MICGDRAIGFNYDVLSCASCKAFFRRNANQNLVGWIFFDFLMNLIYFQETMRCVTGQGQCSVAHGTRRKCQKCRLHRCFSMGMRKDFILSEEERQRRKQRLEENRKITSQRLSTSETIDPLSS
jgi:nuclear receptor subfamily 1 group I